MPPGTRRDRAGPGVAAMPMKIAEVLELLAGDGWYLARTRGSHRQFRHSTKPGTVTVAGPPADTLHPKTPASILRQAGLRDPR
ncbi:MAG TPA: type II toxin-antitoxin system HicA family toxin [Candidatus Dormibacteraeota bacterium]